MRHYTVKGIVQQNRVAERMNITFLKMARIMLSNVNLSKEFWAEAVNIPCCVLNKSPPIVFKCKTHFQVWFAIIVDYSSWKVFCCRAYANAIDGKIKPRVKKCGVKGNMLW